jgi:hypothetical protein
LLERVPDLGAGDREELALALNQMADKAHDLDDIMDRLLKESHTPAEVGELLIAFELTTEQLRGHSDTIDGKLYEIGDRLKGEEPTKPIIRSQTVSPAEQLFDRLLREEGLISYIDAYEILLGERPSPFGNRTHCRPVLQLALRTAPRVHCGLTIQLDALIVSQASRRPGTGHYRGKPYTKEQWLQVFGEWPLVAGG